MKKLLKRILYIISPIAYYPLLFYWFVFRPKTHGVKCVIEHEGKLLMIRNTYGQRLWTFPGGGVKQGETLQNAAAREAYEEVGVEVQEIRHIGEIVSTLEYKIDTVTIFAGKSTTDTFKIDGKEIFEAGWFSPDNPLAISETAREIITLYNENTKHVAQIF